MMMVAEYIVPIHHIQMMTDVEMMADVVMMAASSFISICLLNTNVCCQLLPSAAILNHVSGGVSGGVSGVNVVQRNSFEVMSGVVSDDVMGGALMEPFDGCRSECELRSG